MTRREYMALGIWQSSGRGQANTSWGSGFCFWECTRPQQALADPAQPLLRLRSLRCKSAGAAGHPLRLPSALAHPQTGPISTPYRALHHHLRLSTDALRPCWRSPGTGTGTTASSTHIYSEGGVQRLAVSPSPGRRSRCCGWASRCGGLAEEWHKKAPRYSMVLGEPADLHTVAAGAAPIASRMLRLPEQLRPASRRWRA